MTALETALQLLIKDLVGAEVLIFSDQNSPRPPLPYWTMKVGSSRRVGSDAHSSGVDVAYQETVKGVRESTIQLQRIGTDSFTKCTDIQDLLSKTSVMEKWRLAKIALYNTGDVTNVPYKLDNSQLEPRSSLDLFVRFGTSLLDVVGAIDTVSMEAKFDSKPALTETDAIVL